MVTKKHTIYAWPKQPISWITNRILAVSIPFTWQLSQVRNMLLQKSFLWDQAFVGGPAVYLMPHFFDEMSYVTIGHSFPGVLQKVNPYATKTTSGCIYKCPFCAVWRTEGEFRELQKWPDLPIICDNNLLAASQKHFDKVIKWLIKWEWADFNQGLDVRLLTDYHATRIAQIKKPIIRLALDSMKYANAWEDAFSSLRRAEIAKANIRSYALVAFDMGPDEAWQRCEWIESHGIMALPMWFHALDCLQTNHITENQQELGWDDYERRRIMQWFYQHKKAVKTNKKGTILWQPRKHHMQKA